MIEFCTKKRMVLAVAALIGMSILVLFIENQLTPDSIHQMEHQLNNLSEPEDCWIKEKFDVLEECQPCSALEVKNESMKTCKSAKYRQKIKCEKTGEVFRKCDKVVWLEERHFLYFEFTMLALCFASGSFTFYRQRMLDTRILMKIQKQVAAGV